MAWTRREFMTASALGIAAGAASATPVHHVATSQSMLDVPLDRKDPRIGMVGVGNRGTGLLKNLLGAEGKVVAVCDIDPAAAEKASNLIVKAGYPKPELYTKGDHDFERLVARDDLDLVIVATPWIWHVPVSVAAMEHGKHVGVEVPAVRTIKDAWQIVHTSEKTRRHCMMMENCCYGYNETLVLRMAQAGKFGELLWGEGAYLHDLRKQLFADKSEGLWRRKEHTLRNANLYPTHGLGPVANYLDVLRGDNLTYLVSMSSPEAGLSEYRKEHVDKSDPRWKEMYKEGDFNIALIKTALGRTITLKHDTSSPTPYSRVNAIAGSKGVFMDYPPRIYFDGQAGGEKFVGLEGFKEFEMPLWSKIGELAKRQGGHGGMDFIMLYRLLDNFRNGRVPDMDVYDAALWSSVTDLTAQSIAQGSAPQPFPDFTRGAWKRRHGSPIGNAGNEKS